MVKHPALLMATLLCVLLGLVAPTAAGSQEPAEGRPTNEPIRSYNEIAANKGTVTPAQLSALGPNPYLSIVPNRDPAEVVLWRALAEGSRRAASRASAPVPGELDYHEKEKRGTTGANEVVARGELVRGFGTGLRDQDRARVYGSLIRTPAPDVAGASVEDDGSIPLANETTLTPGVASRFTGVVGDTAYLTDFDFFALGPVSAGDTIVIDIDTSDVDIPVDALVALWSSTGDLIAANDDFDGLDSYLEVPAPADDEYFAMVTGCCALPLDPFDPASGDTGVSNGEYEVDLGVDVAGSAGDVDTYLVDLEAGDALSVAVAGTPATVDLIGPDGDLAMGSSQTAAFIYPDESPLGHQGHIGLDHVAARSGRHAIQVSGGSGGRYQVELRAASSGLSDRDDTATQELFLDFDGAVVDTTVFGGVAPQAYLSPLRSFLFRWGLRPAAENAVIDRVIEVVEENLSHDLKARAANGDRDITGRGGEHDVIITNSRDHADPGNRADVTRLVIGGSIPESGIFTVGIAQSIDPGNFDTSEVALVLLDFLGLPAGQGGLNDFAIDPSASKIDLVGVGVGNITAHEAGHLLGNWHTDNSNRTFNIMDSGGDLAAFVGVGRDGVFGSADDRDVDFRSDVFSFEEGFAGRENSRARTAFALSTGAGRTPIECSISGTPGDDVLTGTEYNDVICGFAGDDILLGGGGRDRLLGGVGDDTLRGAQSSDRLFGGAGDDRGFGGSGSDRLFGRSGDDRLFGQVGNDQLNGGPGIDRLGGGPGTDRCVAGEAYIDCE